MAKQSIFWEWNEGEREIERGGEEIYRKIRRLSMLIRTYALMDNTQKKKVKWYTFQSVIYVEK